MNQVNVLIADPVHEDLVNGLLKKGYRVDNIPNCTYESCKRIIPKYDVLVVRTSFNVNKELIEAGVRLKCIARAGAGMDNIDCLVANERGIKLLNAPEGNSNAVAEHVLSMLFTYVNRIAKANHEVKNLIWDREGNRGIEIESLTLGIIGMGNMGIALWQKAKHLFKNIVAYDKYVAPYNSDDNLRLLFEKADVVSLHIPLTEETKNFFEYNFFRAFQKEIILINTSRGEVIPLKDLITLLDQNVINAALLDVLPNENVKYRDASEQILYSKLANFPNVILTPHVAGWTRESYQKISNVLLGKIIANF